MFRRILIANRMEIAASSARAKSSTSKPSPYSEADADALYLRRADETICTGQVRPRPNPTRHPFDHLGGGDRRRRSIHPGYGFLAENAHFAEVCRSCQIDFIGPAPRPSPPWANGARAREIAMSGWCSACGPRFRRAGA
ncbi:MAG: biotin carboxylase N-terminal domain-containing protein [Planctomycetota bacterium]